MKLYQDEIMFGFVGEPLAPLLAPIFRSIQKSTNRCWTPITWIVQWLRHLLTQNFLQHKIKELIQRWLYCGMLEAKILVGRFLVKSLVKGQGNGVWTLLNVSCIGHGHSLSTKYGIQPEIFNFFLFKRISSYGAYLLNAFYPNTEEKLEVCSYFFYRME